MATRDGRARARRNEIRVLRALHRFGWLRTRDLAVLAWRRWGRKPPAAPTWEPALPGASDLRMAQRTLARMYARHWLLSSAGPDGAVIYSLAEAGVRELRALGISAKTGKDLMRFSGGYYYHRLSANELAVSAIAQGFRAATEREIATQLWFGGGGIAGKRPDVLIRSRTHAWWVEVERSRKNAKDYAFLLKWLDAVRKDLLRPEGPQLLGPSLRWAQIVFICSRAFETRLVTDLKDQGWTAELIHSVVRLTRGRYTGMPA